MGRVERRDHERDLHGALDELDLGLAREELDGEADRLVRDVERQLTALVQVLPVVPVHGPHVVRQALPFIDPREGVRECLPSGGAVPDGERDEPVGHLEDAREFQVAHAGCGAGAERAFRPRARRIDALQWRKARGVHERPDHA